MSRSSEPLARNRQTGYWMQLASRNSPRGSSEKQGKKERKRTIIIKDEVNKKRRNGLHFAVTFLTREHLLRRIYKRCIISYRPSARTANSSSPRASPRTAGGSPHCEITSAMPPFPSWEPNAVQRELHSVFRRRAKAPFTVRKKNSSPQAGCTAGSRRTWQRITEDVTFGAGRKHSGGTSNRISGWVWYCIYTDSAP